MQGFNVLDEKTAGRFLLLSQQADTSMYISLKISQVTFMVHVHVHIFLDTVAYQSATRIQ